MNGEYERMRRELAALNNLLGQTDHVINRLMEGLLTTLEDATPLTIASALASYVRSALTEGGDTLKQRAAWRERVRELRDELSRMEEGGQEDA